MKFHGANLDHTGNTAHNVHYRMEWSEAKQQKEMKQNKMKRHCTPLPFHFAALLMEWDGIVFKTFLMHT